MDGYAGGADSPKRPPPLHTLHDTDADPLQPEDLGSAEDIMMLCETCEHEGPKLVAYLDAGGAIEASSFFSHVDADSKTGVVEFVSRMLGADHSFQKKGAAWTVPRDSHKIVHLVKFLGVAYGAFIYSFTLPDLCARGYVRPLSVVYLTQEPQKLVVYHRKIVAWLGDSIAVWKSASYSYFLSRARCIMQAGQGLVRHAEAKRNDVSSLRKGLKPLFDAVVAGGTPASGGVVHLHVAGDGSPSSADGKSRSNTPTEDAVAAVAAASAGGGPAEKWRSASARSASSGSGGSSGGGDGVSAGTLRFLKEVEKFVRQVKAEGVTLETMTQAIRTTALEESITLVKSHAYIPRAASAAADAEDAVPRSARDKKRTGGGVPSVDSFTSTGSAPESNGTPAVTSGSEGLTHLGTPGWCAFFINFIKKTPSPTPLRPIERWLGTRPWKRCLTKMVLSLQVLDRAEIQLYMSEQEYLSAAPHPLLSAPSGRRKRGGGGGGGKAAPPPASPPAPSRTVILSFGAWYSVCPSSLTSPPPPHRAGGGGGAALPGDVASNMFLTLYSLPLMSAAQHAHAGIAAFFASLREGVARSLMYALLKGRPVFIIGKRCGAYENERGSVRSVVQLLSGFVPSCRILGGGSGGGGGAGPHERRASADSSATAAAAAVQRSFSGTGRASSTSLPQKVATAADDVAAVAAAAEAERKSSLGGASETPPTEEQAAKLHQQPRHTSSNFYSPHQLGGSETQQHPSSEWLRSSVDPNFDMPSVVPFTFSEIRLAHLSTLKLCGILTEEQLVQPAAKYSTLLNIDTGELTGPEYGTGQQGSSSSSVGLRVGSGASSPSPISTTPPSHTTYHYGNTISPHHSSTFSATPVAASGGGGAADASSPAHHLSGTSSPMGWQHADGAGGGGGGWLGEIFSKGKRWPSDASMGYAVQAWLMRIGLRASLMFNALLLQEPLRDAKGAAAAALGVAGIVTPTMIARILGFDVPDCDAMILDYLVRILATATLRAEGVEADPAVPPELRSALGRDAPPQAPFPVLRLDVKLP